MAKSKKNLTKKQNNNYVKTHYKLLKDNDLSFAEKYVFSMILSLSEKRDCFARNSWFSKRLGVSKPYISNIINQLKSKGYVKVEFNYDDNGSLKKRLIKPLKYNNLEFKNAKKDTKQT